MSRLKSVLIVEYGFIRLLLFVQSNGIFTYFDEKRIQYDGFNDKGFINPDDVYAKVNSLFETSADLGAVEKDALIVLPGAFFKYSTDDKDIKIPSGSVTQNDIENVLNSCGVRLPSYEAVSRLPIFYRTLMNPSTRNPLGEKADTLRVIASVEYLKLNIKELFDNCAKIVKKKFEYTSFVSVAGRKAEKDKHCSENIIIVLADGNIDVALCENGLPVDVKSDMLGQRHVCMSLAQELGCSDEVAEEVMLGSNLNLNFGDTDTYCIGASEYSVAEVNVCLADAFIYLGKEVKKCIDGMATENLSTVYFTGSSICSVRGVKNFFEEETGREITVLEGNSLNLNGCDNYIASAVADYLSTTAPKTKNIFKSLFA